MISQGRYWGGICHKNHLIGLELGISPYFYTCGGPDLVLNHIATVPFSLTKVFSMRLRSWLTTLFRQVTNLQSRHVLRRKRYSTTIKSAMVEQLEPRRLLTQAVAVGPVTQVNTQTLNIQTSPAVAMDLSGDYVVTWANSVQGVEAIYAQRYNVSGVAQGGEFQVNTTTTGIQSAPVVAMDSFGDFVIAYSNGPDIFAQRFNASGIKQGGEFMVGPAATYGIPKVAMDASGNFVIAWSADLSTGGVTAQRYNAAGISQGPLIHVGAGRVCTGSSVAMNSTGDFVIDWTSYLGNPNPGSGAPLNAGVTNAALFAQRFNANGTAKGSQISESNYGPDVILSNPAVAIDAADDILMAALVDYPPPNFGPETDFYLYDAANNNLFVAGTRGVGSSGVTMDAAGDFVLAYDDQGFIQGWSYFDTNYYEPNAFAGSTHLYDIGSESAGKYGNPVVAMDPSGDIVVVWQGSAVGSFRNGIVSQRFVQQPSPTISCLNQTKTFVRGSAPLPIAPDLIVTTPINQNIVSGTVTFNNWQPEDRVSYLNPYGFQHTFTQDLAANTATLTFSGYSAFGSATAEQYQTVLKSLTYQDVAGNPNTSATRTATFSLTVDGKHFTTGTQTLNVAKVLSGLSGTINFVSGTPPTPLAPNVNINVPSGHLINSITVSFANWLPEDRVSFFNSVGLQHTFTEDAVAQTATLTISGAASAADYKTLLRSIVFQDVAGNPNTSTVRTFTFTVNDGVNINSETNQIIVNGLVTGLNNSTTYIESTPPLSIAPNLVVAAPQGQQVLSATVLFTNFLPEDRVSFYNSVGLQHTFTQDPVGQTATLRITGAASAADYQTVLRSVVFQDVSGNPNTSLARAVMLTVNDGISIHSASETIFVNGLVMGLNSTTTFVQGASPLSIAPNLFIAAPQGQQVLSDTLLFTNFQPEDRVSFYNSVGLQHMFTQDPVGQTATLRITGAATAADYQTLLQSVVFQDVAGNPNTSLARAVTLTVNDGININSASETIVVNGLISGLNGTTTFVSGSSPPPIAANLVVAVPQGQKVLSATVLFANFQPEDRVSFFNTVGLQHTFTQDLIGQTATLTITGVATAADYQAFLQTVAFQDVAGKPNTSITRVATVTVNDEKNSYSETQYITVSG